MKRRVLMLSWEYPPNHVGGLGRHVYHLGRALARLGVHVTVVTRSPDGRGAVWNDEGVTVVTAPAYSLHPPDFVTWAAQFNVSVMEAVVGNLSAGDFDLIHAHDWIVAYAARALKYSWGVPLVGTIHATEHGRQNGLHNPMQQHISETEWWLCYQACRVVTCSEYMKDEVGRVFGVPGDKVRVIPNGISPSWFDLPREIAPKPLILFVGRLVPEKGPHILVEAMPMVLSEFPEAHLVLAGDGPLEGDIRRRIYQGGLGKAVRLAGRQDDEGLRDLYRKAWVAAFPSSYEPFGIVALEAMATGVPCITGDAGGLKEIIQDGSTGLRVQPDNPQALADAVRALLRDRNWAEGLAKKAKAVASTEYSWDDIARKTLAVYEETLDSTRVTAREAAAAGSDMGILHSLSML
ncbi:MAG: glycosyltransferase family 4 protein [Bacillota bacterium]